MSDAMLPGKIAVVTGGASGNGRAIAEGFVRHGARVIVADLRAEPREGGVPVVEAINATHPGMARYVHCDVSQVADLAAAVAEAEAWGGLDIMVNNAGILMKQPILGATEAVFHKMIDVNVKSVFLRLASGGPGDGAAWPGRDPEPVLDCRNARNRRVCALQHDQGRGAAVVLCAGGRIGSVGNSCEQRRPRHHAHPDECG